MNYENLEIRQEIMKKQIPYYKLAALIGISNCSLSVWLRTPLSPERKARIEQALAQIGG